MAIIQISINDTDEHWDKQIRIFGILIYHRHDYTSTNMKGRIGFNSGHYCPGEIFDN